MKAIYEPKGKAREYGNLACNLYRGCGHGCTYCYAPSVLRMDRQEFYNNPQPRDGIIEALKKDAKQIRDAWYKKLEILQGFPHKQKPERPEVFLCFTTDPYQPINKEYKLTRQAIDILHANEIAVNILTKGEITDFDLLARRPELSKVGVTFDGYSFNHTHAMLTNSTRDNNLVTAKRHGIETWASIEPVISPREIMIWISDMYVHVDTFKIGKWNYDARANEIDWHKFVNEAIELLEKLGCKYYIKKDLKEYIRG